MIEVPVEGQSGGMAVMWNTNLVHVNNFVKRNNEIHALLEVIPSQQTWLFTFIYASTKVSKRNIMWDNITSIFDNYKGAWLLGGDLNDVR